MTDLIVGCCVFSLCTPVSESARESCGPAALSRSVWFFLAQTTKSAVLQARPTKASFCIPRSHINNIRFDINCSRTQLTMLCTHNKSHGIYIILILFLSTLFSLSHNDCLLTLTFEGSNHRLCSFIPLRSRSVGRPQQQHRHRQPRGREARDPRSSSRSVLEVPASPQPATVPQV